MPSEATLIARIRELESELAETIEAANGWEQRCGRFRSVLVLIADLDNCNYDDSQFISFTLNRIRHVVVPVLKSDKADIPGGTIPDVLDCADYTAKRKTSQDEFVDEIGPLPQCRKCGLAVTVCECPKPLYEPFNASGTMCPPSPEMIEEALQAARNRIEDDRQGVNSIMRKNAVLLRALVLATHGDFQGYIDEAERILDME